MTTSILNPESDALVVSGDSGADVPRPSGYTTYRIRHTLASRFRISDRVFGDCLSALAYGTVHYWALAVFFLGGVTLLILWLVRRLEPRFVSRQPKRFAVAAAGNVRARSVSAAAVETSGRSQSQAQFPSSAVCRLTLIPLDSFWCRSRRCRFTSRRFSSSLTRRNVCGCWSEQLRSSDFSCALWD